MRRAILQLPVGFAWRRWLRVFVCLAFVLGSGLQAAHAHAAANLGDWQISAADDHSAPCENDIDHKRHQCCVGGGLCSAVAVMDVAMLVVDNPIIGASGLPVTPLDGRGSVPPFHPPKPIARS